MNTVILLHFEASLGAIKVRHMFHVVGSMAPADFVKVVRAKQDRRGPLKHALPETIELAAGTWSTEGLGGGERLLKLLRTGRHAHRYCSVCTRQKRSSPPVIHLDDKLENSDWPKKHCIRMMSDGRCSYPHCMCTPGGG